MMRKKLGLECLVEFGEHLKQLRELNRLTQTQAAERLGIAKNTYIGYEKGEREPRLSELRKMARLFNMTVGELCMESSPRNIDSDLAAMFDAVSQLNDDEKRTFNELVKAMVIKHHAEQTRQL